jgi:4-amino-4-deoxy-L-arabinose transferase-like glycosyltransferase
VDGQTRYEVARSLVEHGDSVIRDRHVWFAVLTGRDGRKYTNYRFPQSGLGVVAIWLADATGPVSEPRRHFFFSLISPLACAFLALTYALWFRALGHGPGASLAWAAAGILCTPCWFYGTSTFDDLLTAAALVPALTAAFVWRERRPLLGAAASGLFLGLTLNCKQPLAVFVLPALAAVYRPGLGWRRQLAPAALVLGGLALGGVAYKLYDWHKFPPGSTDVGAEAVRVYGAVWTANPLPALAGYALSPSAGVLWHCPTVVLSVAGWLAWRRREPLFCGAVLAASAVVVLFFSFFTFFKGEPCWGPRYLTPVLAVWWLFAPAAVAKLRRPVLVAVLTLGVLVQLLALSVDPLRLFFWRPLRFDYYNHNPWLGFNPAESHLGQRLAEIREILRGTQRAREFAPAPWPTFAPRVTVGPPQAFTSLLGQLAAPRGDGPLVAATSLPSVFDAHLAAAFQESARYYHIFASLRPWWISQQYLVPDERPVDLGRTLALLAVLAASSLVLMAAAARGGR